MKYDLGDAVCPSCGTPFYRDEAWKRTCLACWQKSKRPDKPISEVKRLRAEIAELRALLAKPKPEAIPPDMLARLIRLAHPDKHGNSESANAATAWLLAQRKAA